MHANTIKKIEAAYAEKFPPPTPITECAVYNALRLHQCRSRELESVSRLNQETSIWGSVPQMQPMNWREKQKFMRRKHLEGYLRPTFLKETTSLLPISVPSQPLSQVQEYLERRRNANHPSIKPIDAATGKQEATNTFKVRPYLKSLYEPLTIGDDKVDDSKSTDPAQNDVDMTEVPSGLTLSDTVSQSMSSLQNFLNQIDTAHAKYEPDIATDVQQTMTTEKELLKNPSVMLSVYSSPALAAISATTVEPSPKRKYNKAPKPNATPVAPSTPTPSTPKKRGYEEISLREAEAASEQEERNLRLEIMSMQRQNLLQSRTSNVSSSSPVASSPSASPHPNTANDDVQRTARIEQRESGDVLLISIKRSSIPRGSPGATETTSTASAAGGGRYSSRVRTSAGSQVFCEVCSGPIDNISSKCPRCRYDPLKNQDPDVRRKQYEAAQQEKRREQQQEAQQSGRMQAIAKNMTPW